ARDAVWYWLSSRWLTGFAPAAVSTRPSLAGWRSLLGGCLQCGADRDAPRVQRTVEERPGVRPDPAHQARHAVVVGECVRSDGDATAGRGGRAERAYQPCPESVALPGVGDDHADLDRFGMGPGAGALGQPDHACAGEGDQGVPAAGIHVEQPA